MYIAYIVIDDSINYIVRNWHKAYLLWIDEREHIKGNGIANLTRLNFLGATFRLIHYINFNKKRAIVELWYIFLDNLAISLGLISFILIIVSFIGYGILFLS